MKGNEASHVSAGREGAASYFTPGDATASRRQQVSAVKFKDDKPYCANKALDVVPDERAPGLAAREGSVASRVGTSPLCWPLTADPVQSETRINRIPTARP